MRCLLPAIALVACGAPRPKANELPPSPGATASVAAAPAPSAPAKKTEGEVTVTLFSANGGVEADDFKARITLSGCVKEVGSARGWLLVRIEIDDEGKAKSVQIVERVGLPEGVASCVEGRVRNGYAPAAVVYLSVH
jgi:hypothetical protein